LLNPDLRYNVRVNQTIYLVTAVHNNWFHTKQFLDSILAQTYSHYRVIIVNDGSSDATSKELAIHYPHIKVVKGNGNLYWTAAINLAITEALKQAQNTDFVLAINNDCYLPKNYLKQAIISTRLRPQSIIGSVEIDRRTHNVHGGYFYINWQKGEWLNDRDISQGIKEVDWLTTKGTVFPVAIIRQHGLLDARRFPHYASDVEYTSRLKRNGVKLYLDPNLKVYSDTHQTGYTPSDKYQGGKLTHLFRLAFSRKSTINLIDHYRLINYLCPRKYRLHNYYLLVLKVVYLLSLLSRIGKAKQLIQKYI